jgi:hypothetical protein
MFLRARGVSDVVLNHNSTSVAKSARRAPRDNPLVRPGDHHDLACAELKRGFDRFDPARAASYYHDFFAWKEDD